MDGGSEINLECILSEENQHETVALARALCPFADTATDEQMLMCVALVEAKGNIKAVAELVGWSIARARRHLQSRLSQQIIKKLARHKLSGEGYLIAVCTLMDIASSESQTGNARNNASKAIFDLVDSDKNPGNNEPGEQVDLNNMTLAELEKYVGAIKQDLVRLPAIIDHAPLDE
jgi:hypothetical protein